MRGLTPIPFLVVVETQTTIISTGKRRKRERRYYLSSLELQAVDFQKIIRQHWSIENNCHWVLDVVFREDANQTRKGNAPKNFGTLLRIVLNILKQEKRRHATLDVAYREALLFSRA